MMGIIRRLKRFYSKKELNTESELISKYLNEGRIPWSPGYWQFRNQLISKTLNDKETLKSFEKLSIPSNFGFRLDERIVEYSWIFSNIPDTKIHILDAGSTFNYNFIISHDLLKNKKLDILTFAPEKESFNNRGVSYTYYDLRDMPYKDNLFDCVISQSTIEHIDMDNSIYGYELDHNKESTKKSFEYLSAIKEMSRVVKKDGVIMLTFPYGKFENHGFFQQFDEPMVDEITKSFSKCKEITIHYFKYLEDGWVLSKKDECDDAESFNPHTGKGKKGDYAAHSRAICCIKVIK